jgi:aryl-alcohol dehydrogenase-like predicted oxidoreductase
MIGRLGFGVSGAHGLGWAPVALTSELVTAAFGTGIRLFDTAPVYGDAEIRLGRAIGELPRDEIILSTKAGHRLVRGRRRRDFSPDGIRQSIEMSRTRLGVERIDWLFLHGPSPSELTVDLLRSLEEERHRGRISRLGVAGRGEELDAALATGVFELFMSPVHAGLDTPSRDRLMRIRNSGRQLVAIETLSGATPQVAFPSTPGAIYRLARWAAGRTGPRPAQSGRRPSIAEAFSFALGPGGADFVLTSTTRRAHILENARIVKSLGEAA